VPSAFVPSFMNNRSADAEAASRKIAVEKMARHPGGFTDTSKGAQPTEVSNWFTS
jgi:hypothetical protein